MNWLSAIAAVRKLCSALTGLYRDWRKLLPIWILLTTMNWIAACDSINAPVTGCEWIRLISVVAREDSLTTATKQALLAHNEMYEEICRDD